MTVQQTQPKEEQQEDVHRLQVLWSDERYRFGLFGFLLGASLIAVLELLFNLRLGAVLGGILPELVGVYITVRLIEEIYKRRETAQRREQLVRQAANKNNRLALNAIAELNDNGWLVGEDGALQKQDLSESNLENARFWYANLKESRFWFTNLNNVEFWNADLTGAEMVGADLTNAKLVGANLQGADLSFANLTNTDWRNANLTGIDLGSFDLRGCNMMKANLSKTNLVEANLAEAKLWDARFIEATLSRANFSGADMSFVNLSQATADGARFSDTYLRRTNFTEANLKDADFSHARLGGAYFNGADLTGANLEGTMLIHKNEWNKLLEAKFDEKTILPDGSHYNPDEGLTSLTRFGCVIDTEADVETNARPDGLSPTQEVRPQHDFSDYDPMDRTLIGRDMKDEGER